MTLKAALEKDTTCEWQPSSALSFIEVQFPISKISKESYKERKSTNSQTLTGLGKWWGRKPLILVRASILGLLMPATTNPDRDRQIFLKLLTMDEEGLRQRKAISIGLKEIWARLTLSERREWFSDVEGKLSLKKAKRKYRDQLQYLVFGRLNYDEKLEFCQRPEHSTSLSSQSWAEINAHLGTC